MILKILGIVALIILGPILCYILVYGSSFIFSYIHLRIKAKRFQKKIHKAQDKNVDDLEDIKVEIYDSKTGQTIIK